MTMQPSQVDLSTSVFRQTSASADLSTTEQLIAGSCVRTYQPPVFPVILRQYPFRGVVFSIIQQVKELEGHYSSPDTMSHYIAGNVFSYNVASFCGTLGTSWSINFNPFRPYSLNISGSTFEHNRATGLDTRTIGGGGVMCLKSGPGLEP